MVGIPIANRQEVATENIIGLFVNTLCLRTDFGDGTTFREVLQQVKATALEAYANQDVPFERVVEVLQPQRTRAYNPMFQAMFSVQNAPTSGSEFAPRLRIEELRSGREFHQIGFATEHQRGR